MHKRSKLKEARDFLGRMHAERDNPDSFARELSAFLTASRSVLQYAHKEAVPKHGGQRWYDQAIANPLLAYFKDLRDDNIHALPVRPLTKTQTVRAGFLNIGDDDDEMLIPYPHDTIVYRYEFQDRAGEDVLDLCQQYLCALEDLVDNGVSAGWITG